MAARLERVSRDGTVHLQELPFRTQLNVRLDPKGPAYGEVSAAIGLDLPVEPGTSARTGDVVALWLGPDEWLVTGPPGSREGLTSRLRSALEGAHASLVDVSAQRTTLLVQGPSVRELLAQGCPVDLHPRALPEGRCVQTLLARAQVVLVAVGETPPSLWVLVRASFATYVAEWLLDAATEYTLQGRARG